MSRDKPHPGLQFTNSWQERMAFAGDDTRLMITGDRWLGLVWLKSKPSGIPVSRSTLVCLQNMITSAVLSTSQGPYLWTSSFPSDREGLSEAPSRPPEGTFELFPHQRHRLCLWVTVYFCTNFSHPSISVSAANSLMRFVHGWKKILPYLFINSGH